VPTKVFLLKKQQYGLCFTSHYHIYQTLKTIDFYQKIELNAVKKQLKNIPLIINKFQSITNKKTGFIDQSYISFFLELLIYMDRYI